MKVITQKKSIPGLITDQVNSSNLLYNDRKKWLIVTCGALFYCYQFMIRVSPNVMHDEIILNFSVNEAGYGVIVGFYYWGYSIMQLPMGVAMDKLGPKRIIFISIIACAIASLLFPYTTNPTIASISRFVMGLGAAAGFMGSLKLGAIWLPQNKWSLATGLTMILGTIGASIGGAPLRLLLNIVGWKNVHIMFAILGITLSLLVLLIVKDKPIYKKNNIKIKDQFKGLIKVLKTPQTWLIAILGALEYIPITVMGIAWGVPFLRSVYNITESKAATLATTMFIGAAVGGPIFAYTSEYFKSRKIPLYIGGITSLLMWSIIIGISDIPLSIMYVFFFFAGVFFTAKMLTFTAQCDLHGKSNSAVSVGLNSMIVMIMGGISHPVIGVLLKIKSDNSIPTSTDFRYVLSIIPISLAIGVFLIYFIKETYSGKIK